jgi:hypothetical protein
MKATSSIGSSNILAISSTNRCTIGFPAIGINGFGMVRYEGEDVNHVQPLELLFSFFFYLKKVERIKSKFIVALFF